MTTAIGVRLAPLVVKVLSAAMSAGQWSRHVQLASLHLQMLCQPRSAAATEALEVCGAKVDKQTAVVSMHSCFCSTFAALLQQDTAQPGYWLLFHAKPITTVSLG